MRILKKSLACLLVAIIAATAMFGCLVSADTTYEGWLNVTSVDVLEGSDAAVTFEVTLNNGAIYDEDYNATYIYADAAKVDIALDFAGTISEDITIVDYSVENDEAAFADLGINIDEENNTASILVETNNNLDLGAWNSVTLAITVTPDAAFAVGGTYTLTATANEVNGATYEEEGITYGEASGNVNVYGGATQDSPLTVAWGTSTLAFVPAGTTVYAVSERANAMLTGASNDAYAISYNGADTDAVEEWGAYSSKTILGADTAFTVVNAGETDIYVTFGLAVKGMSDYPEEITAVGYTANITEDMARPTMWGGMMVDGYYYTYTAAEAGTVTVTMNQDSYSYNMTNMNTYESSDMYNSVTNPGTSASIAVSAGDVVKIQVLPVDANGEGTTGTVNWTFAFAAAVTEPEVDENITTTPSINITQTINLRYLFANIPDCDDFYAVVSHDRCDSSYNFIEGGYTVTFEKSDMNSTSDGRYYFLYNQMRLFELNIPITVTLYCLDANDNVIYTSVPSVTKVADQAKASFASSGNANAKTLYSDIIELGSVAQTYFVNGKDVDLADVALPNVGFEGTPSGDIDVSKLDTTYVPNTTAVSLTPSFNLSGNPAVRFLVDGVSEYDLANLKMVISYTSPKYTITDTVLGFDELQVSGTRYYTLYSGIALPDGNQPVTCKIYNGEIAEENIIAETVYSVEYAIANTNSTSRAYDLYMHVAKLGAAARVYFKY